MRTNPFFDTWQFVVRLTQLSFDHGLPRYAFLLAFAALLTAAVGIILLNWRQDATQRTAAHLTTCICRMLIGCMWFQDSLAKLPIPGSDELRMTVEHMAQYAAFDLQRQLVTQFYVPHLGQIGPIVFIVEMSFAVSLILGWAVPVFAALATLFSLQLWLGLYQDPSAWPWTFVLLAVIHALFLTAAAGRVLGLDALLHRHDVTGFKRAFG